MHNQSMAGNGQAVGLRSAIAAVLALAGSTSVAHWENVEFKQRWSAVGTGGDPLSKVLSATVDDDRPTVRIDGKPLPHRFTLEVNTSLASLPEAEPISFALVLPGEVVIDGVTMGVPRPVYVAETELTQAQFAQLREYGHHEGYEQYVDRRLAEYRMDPNVPDDDLESVKEYLSEPDHPAIGIDIVDAAVVTERLTRHGRLTVRMPTIAEWYRAMRAERPTRYWWGDESVEEVRAIDGRSAPLDCNDWLDGIENVQRGLANQLGLKNTIGNVAEFVIPSEAERQTLRARFGPDPEAARWFALSSHGGLALGGSEFTLGASSWAAYSPDEFLSSWEEVIRWCRLIEAGEACRHRDWTTGLRLVIDVPRGEVDTDE